jgi:hypothetical protein
MTKRPSRNPLSKRAARLKPEQVRHALIIPDEKLVDMRIRHLELIQVNIGRLNVFSNSMKGYCLTLFGVIGGYAISNHQPRFSFLLLALVMMFASLDTRYLQLERAMRNLFDIVRHQDWSVRPDFEVSTRYGRGVRLYISAMKSWIIPGFYGPLLIASAIVYYFARPEPALSFSSDLPG